MSNGVDEKCLIKTEYRVVKPIVLCRITPKRYYKFEAKPVGFIVGV
jgi:hypothetical protein